MNKITSVICYLSGLEPMNSRKAKEVEKNAKKDNLQSDPTNRTKLS